MRLAGKVALVTGAAHERSIGWGIARALAEEGADVVVNDVAMPEKLAARVADLEAIGVRGLAVQADVTDATAVDNMVAEAVAKLGHLDIVASNAGIIRWETPLAITPKNLRAITSVNIKGNANVCRAAARQMIAQRIGGRIVMTSSVHVDAHFLPTTVYDGTKFAMQTFVGTLALELAPHQITVNHFGPGWVRSPLNDVDPGQQTDADIEAVRQTVPLRRDGYISEMGRAVVYFASEDGAYTTGAFLRIDGGLGISKYSR